MIEKLSDLGEEAAVFLSKCDYVRVISHHDTDGITAAGILCNALYRSGVQFHATILSRLDEKIVEGLEDPVVVLCDMGSAQPDIISQIDAEVLVFDHHTPSSELLQVHTHINPHLLGIDGASELSASGVAYIVARQMNRNNVDLAGLALVGALGDKQQMTSVNRDILQEAEKHGAVQVKKGLAIGDGEVHELLELCTEPYLPNVSGNSDRVDAFLGEIQIKGRLSELSEEETSRLASAIMLKLMKTASDDAMDALVGNTYTLQHESVSDAVNLMNMLNSAGKLNHPGLALSICLREESAAEKAYELHVEFQKKLLAELENARTRMKTGDSIRYYFAGDKDVTGAIAGTLIRYVFPDMPILAFNSINGYWKISGRGTSKLISKGMDLSVALGEAAKSAGGQGGGHNIASGASIPKGSEEQFISMVDTIVTKQLSG